MGVKENHGVCCPKCGDDEEIYVAFEGTALLVPDGTDDCGDHEWDDDARMWCLACDHAGTAEDFAWPKPATLPPAVVPRTKDGVTIEAPMGSVPTKLEMEHLETLIDRCGLFEVLVALEIVCSDKAAHIRANGTRSDNYLARRWEGAAKACRRAATSKAVEYVDPSYPK